MVTAGKKGFSNVRTKDLFPSLFICLLLNV